MIKHKMKVALWHAQGRACAICFRTLQEPKPSEGHAPEAVSRDHVTPQHQGGGLVLLAHRKCNLVKGGRAPTVKELKFLEVTIAALTPRAMQDLLDSCVERVRQAEKRAEVTRAQITNAQKDLALVVRYASTEQAAKALAKLRRE